ncbi:MAG: amidohydrolase family protein [Bacteroidetes bacterium]|nr:amidohydrolase family protein [Bacteroidota bacterium]
MNNRWITANQIHDGQQFLPVGSCLELDATGRILNIQKQQPNEVVHHLDGIICPGFINAHCHLELSHLRAAIPEGRGLISFLQAVMQLRGHYSDEQKKTARLKAYEELKKNGVVAVGDIANGNDTLDLRLRQELHMHTFVECIGFTEAQAPARLAYSQEIERQFAAQQGQGILLRQSLTAHAPYSVSPALFRLISGHESGSILSVHNGESLAEFEYFRQKTGPVRELLEGLGVDDAYFQTTAARPIQAYLPLIAENHPLILVHNTYSSAADIAFAMLRNAAVFWCLCPAANLYIESCLPDVQMLRRMTENICIGTDSLASNKQLSILEELKILEQNFSLGWELLLRWACFNGACALGMEDTLGSFKTGLKPGINRLYNQAGQWQVERLY